MPSYNQDFYESIYEGSFRSARAILPLVLDWILPRSVIDVGCGHGIWLAVCKELGGQEIYGIDGDWVARENLLIPLESFSVANLSKPFSLNKQFDLVISLEVAEHLPPESAKVFVNSLVELGPVILFSAAIPFQGGDDHKNEQWPEYWSELFKANGYLVVDCLRKKIWNNNDVEYWYRQNILMFIRHDKLRDYNTLKEEYEVRMGEPLSIVHPYNYLKLINYSNSIISNLTIRRTITLLCDKIKESFVIR